MTESFAVRRRSPITLLAPSICLLCLAYLTGCVLPLPPVPTKTAYATVNWKKKSMAKLAPVAGATTRQQVEEQYRAFAVDTGVPNLFWARFRKSNWGIAVGGIYAGHIWGTENVLVLLDQDGTAKTVDTFPDKELVDRFGALQQTLVIPPLDLSKPIPVDCEVSYPAQPWQVELTATGLTVTAPIPSGYATREKIKGQSRVFIPFGQINSIEVFSLDKQPGSARGYKSGGDGIQFKFSEITAVGKGLEIYVEPSQIITLVRWYKQGKRGQL